MKTLTMSSVLVFMLCAPALADPPPRPMRLAFQIKTAAGTRVHELAIAGRDCAHVVDKDTDHDDEIKACAIEDSADGVRLDLEWMTRTGPAEYKSKSSIVVARGGTLELGRSGGTRLALNLK
jgi:hypothetical protein